MLNYVSSIRSLQKCISVGISQLRTLKCTFNSVFPFPVNEACRADDVQPGVLALKAYVSSMPDVVDAAVIVAVLRIHLQDWR